uniref:Bm13564 n=2 Tax=Brugia malayi TaxID=6279 RepID=A0A0H5SBL1_BRUMA|nr:Bm13564 [Brugia malayi]
MNLFMGNHWISKDCCHFERLPTVYFTVLAIQAIAIIQAIAFLLFSYLRDVEIYSTIYDNLKYALHFDCLIPLIIIQLSWFISAIATVYSVQKMIPYLMLPHLFISLFLLFVAILLIILTAYHIITGVQFNSFLILLLLLLSLYSAGALYSIYLTLSYFRLLMSKRKSIINIAEKDIRKEALVDEALSISNSISYSRRPTVIISDDDLHMLHQ